NLHVQASDHFFGNRREHLPWGDPASHQRGHPPQRGLLPGELTQLVAADLQFVAPIGAGRTRHRDARDKVGQQRSADRQPTRPSRSWYCRPQTSCQRPPRPPIIRSAARGPTARPRPMRKPRASWRHHVSILLTPAATRFVRCDQRGISFIPPWPPAPLARTTAPPRAGPRCPTATGGATGGPRRLHQPELRDHYNARRRKNVFRGIRLVDPTKRSLPRVEDPLSYSLVKRQ